MNINQLLETTYTSIGEPGQVAFKSGRNSKSLDEMTAGGTGSGSVASVAAPMGKMHKRVDEKEEHAPINDYDQWRDIVGDSEIHPQRDRVRLVAQSWDGEIIGEFNLKTNQGWVVQNHMKTMESGILRGMSEARLSEEDVIVVPGQMSKRNRGFVPRGSSRVDHEVEMAKSDLLQCFKNAKQIHELIKNLSEDDGLEGWVQEKITKAEDYLNTVRAYLEGKQQSNVDIDEDWQKANRKDKTSGMSSKAVKAYRRENPGSKLKTAVTTKPSKLKPGSKAAKRRKSFCARMSGNKGPMKTPKGKPTPKALALRRWNCESVEEMQQLAMIAEQKIQAMKEAANPAQQAAIAIAKKKDQGVSEGTVIEAKIHSKLVGILQQHGFKGPFKVSETPWADQFDVVTFPEDPIMIQGTDVEYDAWVLNPSGDSGYYFGQESGYQNGNAQQVVSWLKTVVEQKLAEGAVKTLSMDLKSMSDKEFITKYKKTKAEMRASMKSVDEAKQRLDPKCWKGKHKEGTKMKGGVRVNNCVPNESIEEITSIEEEKQGLWANIHAKRERIQHGSGEHMRKPGSKGAPTAAALRKSAK